MPRDPRLTATLTTAIARDVRRGATLGEAARAHGVSRATAYFWLARGAREVDTEAGASSAFGHFCAAVRQARARFAKKLVLRLNRLAHCERPTVEMVRAASDARRTLERRFPEFWGSERARAHARRVANRPATGPQTIPTCTGGPWPDHPN